tara:strand:- start:273 stop:1274 length:1002 start_codon:yes stop_codon:yes gene_type:complete
MKKNKLLKKRIAVFIGSSIMLEECLGKNFKNFKKTYFITSDKDLKKKLKKNSNLTTLKKLRKIKFDYLFSILNKIIIPENIIKRTRVLTLNFHDGPLPKYAGLFSSTWAIIHNEKKHGVCWHKIEKKIDAGDIILEKSFQINKRDTAYSIDIKGALIGVKLFKKILNILNSGKIKFKKQKLNKRTYFGKKNLKKLLNIYNRSHKNPNVLRAFKFSNQKEKQLLDYLKIKKINNNINGEIDEKASLTLNKKRVTKLITIFNKVLETNLSLKKINIKFLEKISLNNHPKWDSLSHVSLLSYFEKKLKVKIDSLNIDRFSNFRTIYEVLTSKNKLN